MSDIKDKKPIVNLPENVPTDYTFERMLKTFMKDVEKSGILREVRMRRYYVKPSEQKRIDRKTRRK